MAGNHESVCNGNCQWRDLDENMGDEAAYMRLVPVELFDKALSRCVDDELKEKLFECEIRGML